MGIPLGKISLFVGAGGFHPEHAMPLVLDAGTNNAELREDKFYMVSRAMGAYGANYFGSCLGRGSFFLQPKADEE